MASGQTGQGLAVGVLVKAASRWLQVAHRGVDRGGRARLLGGEDLDQSGRLVRAGAATGGVLRLVK
jgi:hypothetical protein